MSDSDTGGQDADGESTGASRYPLPGSSALDPAGLASGSGTAVTDGGTRDPQFADSEHDHSGEYGAASRLGEAAPVESIAVEELVTADTPVVDVRAYGVVGDGETDDAAALQAAVDAATPHGVLEIPHTLTVRLETPVDVDLSGADDQNRFAFVCEGALQPAAALGDAVHVHGGGSPYVFARVDGGGKDPETDTAFRVTGTRGGLFEGSATNYGGTVFEFENAATYSVGHLKTWNTGQSFAVYDASPMGEVRDVFDASPVRAPEFHDSSDVCINQYENYMAEGITERGVVFDNCLSVWIDRLAVGGAADTPPAEFRDSRHMFVNALHLGGSPTWGGVVENVVYSTFRVFCNVNEKGLKYAGPDTDGNRVVLNGQNLAEQGLVVAGDVSGGYHYFAGNVVGTSAEAVDVRTSDAEIHLDNFYAVGNDGGDLSVPPDNDVHLSNCRLAAVDGSPRTVDGFGSEAADRETPNAANWNVGDHVAFTDTDDGSGSGLYVLVSEQEWFRYDGETVPA